MSKNKEHTHHIIPLKTYFKVFGALMFLTALTVLAAELDLSALLGEGPWNVVLAMLIAVIKSSLVLLFFMHLYYDNKINLAFILGSVLFLALFIGLTMIDVTRRQDIYDIKGKLVNPHAPIYESTSDEHSGH